MISFALELDPRYVKDTELDSMFNSIKTFLNVTLLTQDNFEHDSVSYRVLKYPPVIELARKFSFPDQGLTLTGPYGGYYSIVDSVLKHDPTIITASNRAVANQPVVHVMAMIYASEAGYSVNAPTRACIGYSIDGGATFVPIASTSRPLNITCGKLRNPFGPLAAQRHYIDQGIAMPAQAGLINWPYDRAVILLATLGGDIQNVSPIGVNAYCVMINDVDSWLVAGVAYLNARENGF